MQDYKPNSHRFKDQEANNDTEKRIVAKKVVKGKCRTRKRSDLEKLTSEVIMGDMTKVKDHLFSDILLPALKKLILDMISDGASMLLYNNTTANKKSNSSRVSYREYYNESEGRSIRASRSTTKSKSAFDLDFISFETQADALIVLESMEEVIDTYGFVRVSDFYDFSGYTSTNYMIEKYGWDNLRDARPVRYSDGWGLRLPRPMPIR